VFYPEVYHGVFTGIFHFSLLWFCRFYFLGASCELVERLVSSVLYFLVFFFECLVYASDEVCDADGAYVEFQDQR
jgi:hypothetical protein